MGNNTIDYEIKSAWHSIFKMYNQVAQKYDTSQATGFLLLSIAKEGTPSTSIAPAMGMEATSLSRILKTLEEKNLIYRKKDDKDGRMVRIFLTPEGVEKRRRQTSSGFVWKLVQKQPQLCWGGQHSLTNTEIS